LAHFLAGAPVTTIYAIALKESHHLDNTVVIQLGFSNGSIASLSYFSNGNKKIPKEFIEVFCGGTVAQIIDFKELKIFGTTIKNIKYHEQDKGHASEVNNFLKSISNGGTNPIPFHESYLSTLATFKIVESIKTGKAITL